MKKSKAKKIATSVIVGLIIGSTIAGLTAFAKVYVHGKFLPKTSLAGVDISFQEPAIVQQYFSPKVEDFYTKEITLNIDQQTHQIPISSLGIEVMLDQTISTIKKADAQETSVLDLVSTTSDQKNFDFIVQIDQETLNKTLEEKFELQEKAPKSASFTLDSGQLKITDSQEGTLIDQQELLKKIKENARTLETKEVSISSSTQEPTIKKEHLEAQREKIETILNHQITLVDPVYSNDWQIKLRDHTDWLEFKQEQSLELENILEKEETEPQIKVAIKQTALDQYIDEEISEWLDKEVENTKIIGDQEGNIKFEGTGKDGMKIQRKMMKESMELAFNDLVSEITIPVLTMPTELIISPALQEMGIKERIAQGHTSYYGSSANRIHNIKVGAEQFNGKMIQPGENFSFNTNLGAVDGSTGYRKELVIKAEGTIPEYGGGICQVSTTMYRAALTGGLEITDRRQHTYAVSYYAQIDGHGLDATIYLGGQDFQFRNDTEHPILMHTYVDEDYELYINFYGTSDGRKVELEGPFISNHRSPGPTQYIDSPNLAPGTTKQVEKPHTGFSADWNYKLTKANGEIVEKRLETAYKAVPAKILVGPGFPSSPQSP